MAQNEETTEVIPPNRANEGKALSDRQRKHVTGIFNRLHEVQDDLIQKVNSGADITTKEVAVIEALNYIENGPSVKDKPIFLKANE